MVQFEPSLWLLTHIGNMFRIQTQAGKYPNDNVILLNAHICVIAINHKYQTLCIF